ncbi:MAG: hypothetical protein IT580_04460, partial [Verrucomicrobiales bacterium]|nr:hypothetical protein [Verrucomicrobiales bacterium]
MRFPLLLLLRRLIAGCRTAGTPRAHLLNLVHHHTRAHALPLRLAIALSALALAHHASAAAEPPRDRPTLSLNGDWEFKLDPEDEGLAQRWVEGSPPFGRTIRVPGSWNAQGMAFPTEAQLRKYEDQRLEEQKSLNSRGILGVQRESDRLFSAFPGPAWYR